MNDYQIEINGKNRIVLAKDNSAFITIHDNELRGHIHDLYMINVKTKLKYKIETTIKVLKFIWVK